MGAGGSAVAGVVRAEHAGIHALHRAAQPAGSVLVSLRVLQYNLLCPAYGVKWREREACEDASLPDGERVSNWPRRWPALRRVLHSAAWDVVALQELEGSTRGDVTAALQEHGLELRYWKHPGREDAVGIAFRAAAFSAAGTRAAERGPVVTGVLDLVHTASSATVRVLSTHQKGGLADQMSALLAAADGCGADARPPDLTLVAGDFNEDFAAHAGGVATSPPALAGYTALGRGEGLPAVSRPEHKQAADQKSGKGLVDWVWVRAGEGLAVQCTRDVESHATVLLSHALCTETGEWPSDHGAEALTVSALRPPAPRL